MAQQRRRPTVQSPREKDAIQKIMENKGSHTITQQCCTLYCVRHRSQARRFWEPPPPLLSVGAMTFVPPESCEALPTSRRSSPAKESESDFSCRIETLVGGLSVRQIFRLKKLAWFAWLLLGALGIKCEIEVGVMRRFHVLDRKRGDRGIVQRLLQRRTAEPRQHPWAQVLLNFNFMH